MKKLTLGRVAKGFFHNSCSQIANAILPQCRAAANNVQSEARIFLLPKKDIVKPENLGDFVPTPAKVIAFVDTIPEGRLAEMMATRPLKKEQFLLHLSFEVCDISRLGMPRYLRYSDAIFIDRDQICKDPYIFLLTLEKKIELNMVIDPIGESLFSK